MDHRIALGFVLLSAVLFGCSGVWGKALFHTDLTPVQVTGFRILVAGLCVAIFAGFRGAKSFHVTKPQFLFLAGFSVMFTLVQLSFFVAVALTSVAVALTLQYTAPAFVVLWEKLRHGRPIGTIRLLSMVAALAGCALIAQVGNAAYLNDNLAGIFAGFVCGLILAAYNVMGNQVPGRGVSSGTAAFYSFGLSALAWLVFLPIYAPASNNLNAETIGQILLLGVAATFVPFVLLIVGLRHVGAFEATIMGMMDPVAGGLLAYVVLGEHLSLAQMIGMGLVLGAVVTLSSTPSLSQSPLPQGRKAGILKSREQ
ncbi:MAG: hypothetical protein DI587_37855 [Variovorax paradoxus]|nr:MAG: hypothetical protein DI583_37855 [Variovorax paradoxus]PZP99855.1 MAG: hypothetical protein DI587_37855 [Variovorax paradoxus]